MRFNMILILVLLLSASCGRIPEPIGYDYSEQNKMQASHHWNILAADIANEINNQLVISDYLATPVYVRETCGDENVPCNPQQTTVFNETFRDLLITQLVKLGVPTSSIPNDKAIVVNYKAQLVYHQRNRLRTIKPGLITALTAGVIVLRNAPSEILALATAGAIDFANATYASTSNFEIIITTSMITKNNYLYRNSNIYYINDQDSWHYQMVSNPAVISLTAGNTATPQKQENEALRQELPNPIIPQSTKPDSTGIQPIQGPVL